MMNASFYLAQQRIAELQRETDRRARSARPVRAHHTLRDRLRRNHGA